MPVAINSPARNFFLLGSSGGDIVTNFFRTIDLSSGNEDVYVAEAIKYSAADQKFITAGTAENNNTNVGWFEKRNDAGTADWSVKVSATESGVDTTLRAMELDVNGNLIVGGKTGTVPWIAKYSNGGVIDWQSTTNSGDLEYTGITSDSNGQYYACGKTAPPSEGDTQAFVEKFDASGNPGWGKSAFMLGRDVILNKIAANSRGEVVAAGYLIDLNSANGYIVKIDTNTGEVLWDRTLEGGAQNTTVYCNDVFIDANDQIYIVGLYDDGSGGRGFIVKYSPEGNIIWQRQTPETYPGEIVYYAVKSDSETEQTIVFGEYGDPGSNDRGGILSKYSKDGTLVWRRTIFSSYNNSDTFSNVCLDSDSSFYYLLYNDEEINSLFGYPVGYTYGKVSSSGNGLGSFVYQDGIGEEMYYDILNLQDEIGVLSDGSVRNDISDFITYPFNANKILFDDLATQVSNKKRQMDSADSFEYSGSPAIRPADFSDVNVVAGETTIPAQNRQNMIGQTQLMTPSGAYVNDNDDYTRRWRAQSANVVYDYGFAGPYDDPAATTAGRYAITAATGRRLEYAGPVVVAGQQYTFSIWLKRIASDAQFRFQAYDVGGSNYVMNEVDFYGNLIKTISTGTTVYYPEDDGWHRISITFTSNLSTTIAIGGFDSSGSTGNRWYLYGAQFVDGTLPLQYHAITDSANGGTDPRIDTLKDTTPPVTSGYFDFSGNDSAQDMIELPSVDYRDAIWSAEAWIYIPSTWTSGSQYPNIISQGASAGWDTPGWSLYCFRNTGSGTGYRIGVGMRNRNGTLGVNGVAIETLNADDQPTNTWIHAVATCDGTTRRLYINGNEVNSGSQTISFFDQNELDGKPLETVKVGGSFNINGGFRNFFPGRIGEARSYGRALTAAQVFQNYNATKSKYLNEAPDTAPKISTDGIVYGSNLLLNYDFGNRACYERTNQNLVPYSQGDDWISNWTNVSATILSTTERSPVGTNDAVKYTGTGFALDVSMTSGKTYVWSAYVKVVDAAGDTIKVGHGASQYGSSGNFRANIRYNLSDFSAEYDTDFNNASIYDAVPVGDGWYRIGGKAYKGDTNQGQFEIYIGNMNATVIVWGPQLEEWDGIGAFEDNPPKASRYFGTTGTAVNNVSTTVKNLASSSYTGTIRGGATVSNGTAIVNSTGVTDYIDTGSPVLTTQANFSIEGWIKILNTSKSSSIFDARDAGSDGTSFIFSNPSGNKFYFQLNTANIQSTTVAAQDTWYHVVATNSSGGNAAIYVNGVRENILGLNQSINVSTLAYNTIGIRSFDISNGVSSAAEYGEIRVYDKTLSTTEVLQNFNATRSKYGV